MQTQYSVRSRRPPVGARPRRDWCRDGSSLIELLLLIGLTTMMAGVIVSFSLLSNQIGARDELIANVEQSGMLAMELITQKVQAADVVSVTSGTLTLTTAGQTTTVELTPGGRIKMTEGTEDSYLSPASTVIEDIDFVLLGQTASTKRGVTISFTIANKSAPGAAALFDYSKTFRTTVAGR